jgi:hypothetical protein
VEVTPARIRVRQTEALCAEEDAQLCGFSNEISEKTFSKNEQLKNLIREAKRTLKIAAMSITFCQQMFIVQLVGIGTGTSSISYIFSLFVSTCVSFSVGTGTVPWSLCCGLALF